MLQNSSHQSTVNDSAPIWGSGGCSWSPRVIWIEYTRDAFPPKLLGTPHLICSWLLVRKLCEWVSWELSYTMDLKKHGYWKSYKNVFVIHNVQVKFIDKNNIKLWFCHYFFHFFIKSSNFSLINCLPFLKLLMDWIV